MRRGSHMTRKTFLLAMTLSALIFLPGVAFGYAEGGSVTFPGGDCVPCHQGDWVAVRQGLHGGFTATTDKCDVCHNVHVAASTSKLLIRATGTATCLACHDGTGGRGVYGVIKARTGVDPTISGGAHRSVTPVTNLVPGGDPGGGDRTETEYSDDTGFLGCGDCHSPHGSNIVAQYSTERARNYNIDLYKSQSTNLLKQRPNGSDTTTTVYGSDWCAGCHRGRHSGGGAVNHPVDSTYTYDNVPLSSWPGPVEVAVSAAGDVYVADPGNHRVQRFSNAGGYLGQWSTGYGGLTFEDPRGVAVVAGEVLVSDPRKGYVSRFQTDGTYIGYFSAPIRRSSFAGDYQITPAGIGTNAGGTALVVADPEGSDVAVRTPPAGALAGRIPQPLWSPYPGTAPNQFYLPTDATVDSAGNIYVADSMNKRVVKYNSARTLVGVFATGSFERPISIAVDSSDRVYVADAGKHQVFRYLSNGTLQATFGTLGTGNAQFSAPKGVALDAGGNIYVVDSGNSRVQVLANDGTYLRSWGTKGSGNSQFDFNPVTVGRLAYSSPRGDYPVTLGHVYGGLGYVMQEPRAAVQVGRGPICQQCHEDTRFAGSLYDGVALAGPTLSFPDGYINQTMYSQLIDSVMYNGGIRDVASPRFQTFPHETVNDRMVIETGDDLCLNCHGKSLP